MSNFRARSFDLKHLDGELHISDLENISGKEDAAKADICGKKNLCRVYFRWSEHRFVNQNDKDMMYWKACNPMEI